MPRLREVAKSDASENVRKYYEALFGDRDPVAEPGTATGTPGNWWTVFALVPYIFDHATSHFGMFGMFADESVSQLDGKVRELGILRAGYAQGSQFVFSQHCKASRRFGVTDEQIAAIPSWQVSDVFDAKERAILAWADALILQGGRASDDLFEALHSHLSDEDILELTYHIMGYNLHAVCCKALRLEFDDVPERIREVPVPGEGETADWAGGAWQKEDSRREDKTVSDTDSIEYGGLHHLALVCRDMERTVDFYTNVLEMKLKKGFDLDGGYGQHFFFDMGGGNDLAFFWFRDAPEAQPGSTSAGHLVGSKEGTISSAVSSMNHVAFSVAPEKIEAYRDRLVARGVECTSLVNHDDVVTGDEARTANQVTAKTWLRSFYFFDPDGIMLEFCATLEAGTGDVELPVNADGIKANGQPITGAP